MRLQVGQTLRSVTDTTMVVVVRASAEEVELTCGGEEMVDAKTAPGTSLPAMEGETNGSLLGKRYEDPKATIEVLCTKAGTSSLSLNGEPMTVKTAKPLPASD